MSLPVPPARLGKRLGKSFFDRSVHEVAPALIGTTLLVDGVGGIITEVEAYHHTEPAAHSYNGPTPRNRVMFGPPGHAYVYFSYGMHFALNMVCSPEGAASGVLIRAGEVVAGAEIARSRREAGRSSNPIHDRQLARGPGNVASALGITRPEHDGRDLFAAPFDLRASPVASKRIAAGPRVGVSGEAGSAAFPWRFWIDGDPTVSAYRPGRNVPK